MKFKEILKKIKINHLKESCYTKREYEGHAAMGLCSGLAGGDKNSNYLQYECIGCPHYVELE